VPAAGAGAAAEAVPKVRQIAADSPADSAAKPSQPSVARWPASALPISLVSTMPAPGPA